MNITNLTSAQLTQIIALKVKIESLQAEIESIAGGGEIPVPSALKAPKKHRRSAATRARMAAAQQARWTRIKGTDATDSKPAKKGKRRMSKAGRAAISAAAKARWAKLRGNEATPKAG
jgi:hypothetical protein